MEQKILQVKGMSCQHCVKAVTDAAGALPGVKDLSVDLKAGTVSFCYQPEKTTLQMIEAAIVEAGYEIASS
jgi:copper chaperone